VSAKPRKTAAKSSKPRKPAADDAAPTLHAARNNSAADVTPKPSRIVIEQKEAARILGITDRQLRNWKDLPGFPSWEAGWDLDAITRWRDEEGKKGSLENDARKDLRNQLDLEELEQSKLKTIRERRRLELEEKELLPRRGVELFASTVLTSLGDWCEQLPDIIAGACSKDCRETVRARLEQELDDRRRDLREEFDRKAAEWREAETAEAA
jgi:hypothetical protein